MAKESCIIYPAQSELVIIREPLMAICQIPVTNEEGKKTIAPDPQAAAAILSQFIFWTDGKLRDTHQSRYHAAAAATEQKENRQDYSLWIYKTYDELKIDLLDLFGRNKIIDNVQWLIAAGYLKCRTNPRYRWDKTLQYSVDIELVQTRINAAPSFKFKLSSVPKQPIESAKNKRAIPENTDIEDSKEKEELPLRAATQTRADTSPLENPDAYSIAEGAEDDYHGVSKPSSRTPVKVHSVEGNENPPLESIPTKRKTQTAKDKSSSPFRAAPSSFSEASEPPAPKTPRPRSAKQIERDEAMEALAAAMGVTLTKADYALYSKVSRELIESTIPISEFKTYVQRVRKSTDGKWTVTINSLIANGRPSEYVTARNAYNAQQGAKNSPHVYLGQEVSKNAYNPRLDPAYAPPMEKSS